MKDYERRSAEIQIALIANHIYKSNRNMQALVNFFRDTAKLLNIPNPEYIETAVINYKKLMPTIHELVMVSDLAKSRSKYQKSSIIKEFVGRNKFYETLKQTNMVDELVSKTNPQIGDTLVKYIIGLKELSQNLSDFICDKYEDML